MNSKTLEEIATYEVFDKSGITHIKAPLTGLDYPKFVLKEEENSLYIFVLNYTVGYVIKNIDPKTLRSIKEGKCYFIEGLLAQDNAEHYIDLSPTI